MKVKLIEVRDTATFIPVLAIQLNPRNEKERYLLSRAGYGVNATDQQQYVLVIRLTDNHYDPYSHKDSRTMLTAHKHIINCFGEIESGGVVDVEYILGESMAPKKSESEER